MVVRNSGRRAEDDPPPRRKADPEADEPRRRREPEDDDPPPRRRSREPEPADDDPPPRRRSREPEPADDDPPPRRRSREPDPEDDPPPRRRSREPDPEDDPPPRRRSREPEDDPPPRRGSKSGFAGGNDFGYEGRTAEDINERANMQGGVFDSYIKSDVKVFKPQAGDHHIRIMQPTWKDKAKYGKNWAVEIWVHNNVGPDNAAYLCLKKMLGQQCPVCDARLEMLEAGEEEDAKQIKLGRREVAWIIDRNNEKAGPQVWPMPFQTVEKQIQAASQDKRTKAALLIDDPNEGYDVYFTRTGSKKLTKYDGIQLDRVQTPLSEDGETMAKWIAYIKEKPIPTVLNFFAVDYIDNVLNARVSRDDKKGEGEDEPQPSRRQSREPEPDPDDDPPPRRRSREPEPADDDPPPRRRSREPDPEDDPPPRRRSREPEPDPDDDPPPRRRSREPEEAEAPLEDGDGKGGRSRRTRSAPDPDDDPPPRRRAREPEPADDDPPPRRRTREPDPDDDPPPRRRRQAEADPDDEIPSNGSRRAQAKDDEPRGGKIARVKDKGDVSETTRENLEGLRRGK